MQLSLVACGAESPTSMAKSVPVKVDAVASAVPLTMNIAFTFGGSGGVGGTLSGSIEGVGSATSTGLTLLREPFGRPAFRLTSSIF